LIGRLHRLLPGILLCVAITGVAILLQAVEVYFVREAYLEALVLAIMVGVVVGARGRRSAEYQRRHVESRLRNIRKELQVDDAAIALLEAYKKA
jgi:uncharacterized membrane protein YadS